MSTSWPSEPALAASDFDPFTREVAIPPARPCPATLPRRPAGPGHVTRPVPRSLLEMGLACGSGAGELAARHDAAMAAARRADLAADPRGATPAIPAEPPLATATSPSLDPVAADAGDPAGPADPPTLAAVATAFLTLERRRAGLAATLAALEREQTALHDRLLRLLERNGG